MLNLTFILQNYSFYMTSLVNGLSKIQYTLEEKVQLNRPPDSSTLIHNFPMNHETIYCQFCPTDGLSAQSGVLLLFIFKSIPNYYQEDLLPHPFPR